MCGHFFFPRNASPLLTHFGRYQMRVAYANSKSSINQAKVDNMALMERYEASINEMKEFEEKRVTLHKDYDNLTVVINTCIQKLIESGNVTIPSVLPPQHGIDTIP